MAATRLVCPLCQGMLQIEESMAGKPVRCPTCQGTFTAPPAPTEGNWHVARGGQRYGPFPLSQLQAMVAAGNLQPADLVWREGMAQWVAASTVAGLIPVTSSRNVPPPAPAGDGGMVLLGPDTVAPSGPAAGAVLIQQVKLHLGRAFAWNLGAVTVTDVERAQLENDGIDEPRMQQYVAWRRSILWIVILPVFLGAVFATIDHFAGDTSHFNGMGHFVMIMNLLSLFALPVAAVAAALQWSNLRRSRTTIVVGWGVSFAIPILVALIPLRWLVDVGSGAEAVAIDLLGSLGYLLTFMPVVISLISGVLRACLRVKTLLPASLVPGWFLVSAAPLYALLMLVAFIAVNQIAGNVLLILAVGLLLAAPVVYLVNATTFVRPLADQEDMQKISRVQLIFTALVALAVILLVVYATTTELFGKRLVGWSDATSLMRPWSLLRVYFEYTGRSLFMTAIVADLFLFINLSFWKRSREFAGTPQAKEYDQLMAKLETVVEKP